LNVPRAERRAVLALNAGSSSIKFGLFETDDVALTPVSRGQVEGIGTSPHFIAKDPAGTVLTERRWKDPEQTHEAVLGDLLDWAGAHLGTDVLVGVGHRVVHGGPRHDRPALITDDLVDELDRLRPLAPLHQPHSLSPMRAIMRLRPELPQVACFDTGFHHGMPPVATRFALPREYEAQGVRRYGFHGLSYEYIAGKLKEVAPSLADGRTVAAHLGNGASLCAMLGGRSVDTTMSLTALDGLVMGTRCGSIDPGAVLYLQQAHRLTAAQVEDLLYRRSGLLGVSGVSSDMRTLVASDAPSAREAIELFVFRIAREVGALTSSLGGLDGLVFTAGIGEHAPCVRAAVCERLAWLGVELDEAANAAGADRISTPRSRVEVRMIPTDEEAMIARHTIETIGHGSDVEGETAL
jgi:acetate kinase